MKLNITTETQSGSTGIAASAATFLFVPPRWTGGIDEAIDIFLNHLLPNIQLHKIHLISFHQRTPVRRGG
jgi:hypothetical protein